MTIPRFVRDWFAVVLLGTIALLGLAKVGEDVFERRARAVLLRDTAVNGT